MRARARAWQSPRYKRRVGSSRPPACYTWSAVRWRSRLSQRSSRNADCCSYLGVQASIQATKKIPVERVIADASHQKYESQVVISAFMSSTSVYTWYTVLQECYQFFFYYCSFFFFIKHACSNLQLFQYAQLWLIFAFYFLRWDVLL